MQLTPAQEHQRAEFRRFVEDKVVPHAAAFDAQQTMPRAFIQTIADSGYLGALAPRIYNGLDLAMIEFGLLNEEFGRACSSLRSLLTVQSMVIQAIAKWGTLAQKEKWLPRLAAGEIIGAFALTETNAGSNAHEMEATVLEEDGFFHITGIKKWITFGQIADLFLVFASDLGGPQAFLVENDRAGLTRVPIEGMLGVRGSMLADVHFARCTVPKEGLLGRPGFGLSHVASFALDVGKYSVAWGCLGIAEACLESSLRYASKRMQFGKRLDQHQLIQKMITTMVAATEATRLMCLRAGYLKEARDVESFFHTSLAKYFAAKAAMQTASDAVQIHGANGCRNSCPVERFFRDARIMEIIEGSTEIHEINIAQRAGAIYGLADCTSY